MRNRLANCALIGVVLVSAVPSAFGEESTVRRGEALLSKNCARCHAIGRSGASPHPVAPPFRTLSGRYPIEGLAEALAEGLSVGHPDMPEFVFDPPDIRAILDYLNSIQEKK
jgi:mono/diheme cytochrome c family protein